VRLWVGGAELAPVMGMSAAGRTAWQRAGTCAGEGRKPSPQRRLCGLVFVRCIVHM